MPGADANLVASSERDNAQVPRRARPDLETYNRVRYSSAIWLYGPVDAPLQH